ncbi:MAG: hypothetical protein JNL23_00255 [Chitinophagaceae bacterium]|nr:hypothetical protein [Chitinophagaceae bacterium]
MLHELMAFMNSALKDRLVSYDAIAFKDISASTTAKIKEILNQKLSRGTKRYDDLKKILNNEIPFKDAYNLLSQLDSKSATRDFFDSKFHESTIPKIIKLLKEKIKVFTEGPSDVIIDKVEYDKALERLTADSKKQARVATSKVIGRTVDYTVSKISPDVYSIEFKNTLDANLVLLKVFDKGIQPFSGVQLIQDSDPKVWILRIEAAGFDLSKSWNIDVSFTPELYNILYQGRGGKLSPTMFDNILASSDTPQESHTRYLSSLAAIVPFLGISVEEVLRTYKDGWYEANGYTFYVGYDRSLNNSRGIDAIKDSDYYINALGIDKDAYVRNIKDFLKMGYNMTQAKENTAILWKQMNIQMIKAFLTTLASAPGAGPRLEMGTGPDANLLSATELALQAYSWNKFQKPILEDLLDPKDKDEEFDALDIEIANELRAAHARLGNKLFETDLTTGQLGEAIIKKTLELRGYTVFQIQNESGNGIDLIAFKEDKSGNVKIRYFEVKSSVKDYRGKLSEAQKNPDKFVKSRLKDMAERTDRYTNLDANSARVASICLDEINRGNGVIGIRVDVHDLGKGVYFKVKFTRWKLPFAKTVAPKTSGSKGKATPKIGR